jgi:hypothetical protein
MFAPSERAVGVVTKTAPPIATNSPTARLPSATTPTATTEREISP